MASTYHASPSVGSSLSAAWQCADAAVASSAARSASASRVRRRAGDGAGRFVPDAAGGFGFAQVEVFHGKLIGGRPRQGGRRGRMLRPEGERVSARVIAAQDKLDLAPGIGHSAYAEALGQRAQGWRIIGFCLERPAEAVSCTGPGEAGGRVPCVGEARGGGRVRSGVVSHWMRPSWRHKGAGFEAFAREDRPGQIELRESRSGMRHSRDRRPVS